MMNQCKTSYFTCPTCDVLIRDTSDVNIYDTLNEKITALREDLGGYEKDNTKLTEQIEQLKVKVSEAEISKERQSQHLSEKKKLKEKILELEKEAAGQDMKIKMQGGIIQTMREKEKRTSNTSENQMHSSNIDAKLEAFSTSILSKVSEIMEKKMDGLKTNLKIPTELVESTNPNENKPTSWSTVASQPKTMKAVMREARNDEKIEESEKQRRANNLIIHGAEEIGETPDDIKNGDAGYIKEIFTKIGVEATPVAIARLGEANDRKKRPIKIVMKSQEDKDKVMSSLGRLKGTERYFGKISVKDDYTTNEREQIRMLTEEAKQKSEESPDREFKVRGNSKNGWRVVSFLKK